MHLVGKKTQTRTKSKKNNKKKEQKKEQNTCPFFYVCIKMSNLTGNK